MEIGFGGPETTGGLELGFSQAGVGGAQMESELGAGEQGRGQFPFPTPIPPPDPHSFPLNFTASLFAGTLSRDPPGSWRVQLSHLAVFSSKLLMSSPAPSLASPPWVRGRRFS